MIKSYRYLYAMGKLAWKKWKKRYHVVYEVADKLYALCSFKEKKEKKSEHNESILLDGYFVDYIEADKGKFKVKRLLFRMLFFKVHRGFVQKKLNINECWECNAQCSTQTFFKLLKLRYSQRKIMRNRNNLIIRTLLSVLRDGSWTASEEFFLSLLTRGSSSNWRVCVLGCSCRRFWNLCVNLPASALTVPVWRSWCKVSIQTYFGGIYDVLLNLWGIGFGCMTPYRDAVTPERAQNLT